MGERDRAAARPGPVRGGRPVADRRVQRVGLPLPRSQEPTFINVGRGGRGELAFGVVNASLDLAYSRTIVFFTFEGSDEGDEVNGSGSAGRPLIKKPRFGVFYEGLVWEMDGLYRRAGPVEKPGSVALGPNL